MLLDLIVLVSTVEDGPAREIRSALPDIFACYSNGTRRVISTVMTGEELTASHIMLSETRRCSCTCIGVPRASHAYDIMRHPT